ncbi:Hypothetical_protein [Hexamita inflata]|uniref:Hypothetical_protein n=1 Tax=Hexamita inflata TaxID=28002 RepID=A0ABP1HQY6_9EUKA
MNNQITAILVYLRLLTRLKYKFFKRNRKPQQQLQFNMQNLCNLRSLQQTDVLLCFFPKLWRLMSHLLKNSKSNREKVRQKNANSHLALTPEDKKIKIPAPSRIESYRQIMKAIALISPNVVIHGFEKIGILRTSTSTVPPTLYVSKGGHQIMGFAKFSYQKRIWTYCDNENNIGLDQILFPKDDIEDDDEDILNGLPMMPSQE